MSKKQQIEEMANIIMNAIPETLQYVVAPANVQEARLEAEALYNAGCRRVPKNAVVLTREEFDRLNSCIKSEEEVRAIMEQQMLPMVRELTDKEMNKKLATVTALERKATAQEFLLQVIKQSGQMDMVSNGIVLKTTYSINRDCLIEIARQFGAEVKV